MSSTVKACLVFGLAAVVAFAAGIFIPLPFINALVAFGSMLALG